MNYKTGDKVERNRENGDEDKADVFDNILTQLKTEGGMKKVLPAKKVVSDKDRAQERREKLERM